MVNKVKQKITRKGFSPGKLGTAQVMGELQSAIMEVLWREPGLTVTEVEEKLNRKRTIAHTTVLTILTRMYDQAILLREKHGKAFVYSPRYSKQEFERGIAQEVLSGLLSQFAEPALSTFVELVGDDGEKLDRLEELIRHKREQKTARRNET